MDRTTPRPTRRWHRLVASLAGLGAVAMVASTATAGFPTAGGHYPNGAEEFMIGALPPPGLYLINYLAYIEKDKWADNSGNKVMDLDVKALVEVPRFVWVSPYTLLGASYGAHAFFPMYWADVELAGGAVTSTDSGLGDVIFSPFVLGWHFGPSFHAVFALDIWAPTGNYDNQELATTILSRNHWTFEPVLALTYLRSGFDLSVKLMYDFNTTNDEFLPPGAPGEVDLKSGQEFHFDWGVNYTLGGGFQVGPAGYSYWQITDDEVAGSKVKNEKGRVHAIGGAIKYWPNMGPFSLTVKHLQETGAKNMVEGQSTWLKLIWAL
ncbi:MAG: SphA family protein [Deferrisomatales bacterium]